MLHKAHLTSHSRMSGSRWVITPSWLSGLWRSFLYSSSVYSCSLFLLSPASIKSIPFLSTHVAQMAIFHSLLWLSNITLFAYLNLWTSESVSYSVMFNSLWPHGLFVHGILHARTLEWVAIPFSRGSSDPGIKPVHSALQADSLLFEPLGRLCVCI